MYRGEALEDFTGPDCRFVNFKRGDNVYVYYKLAGKSPEVWAGSVSKYLTYFFFLFHHQKGFIQEKERIVIHNMHLVSLVQILLGKRERMTYFSLDFVSACLALLI